MYATRFADGPRFSPTSMGAALAINGGIIAALLFANPDFVRKIVPKPIQTIIVEPITEPKPEPKPTQKANPRPQPSATAVTPRREIETPTKSENTLRGETVIRDPVGPGPTTTERPADPPVPPLFVAAREDPRYRSEFQPAYPDFERDAGREDLVTLRVRIGIDGRVKQIERLGGRDSFARAAIAHALAKWRFKPATRGGVPEESWRMMTVRFQLDG